MTILGATDAQKLQCSMTLFARVPEVEGDPALFHPVLDRYFDGGDDGEQPRGVEQRRAAGAITYSSNVGARSRAAGGAVPPIDVTSPVDRETG